MDIDSFEFYPDGDTTKTPGVVGLNIQKRYGQTHVNLFALDDNKGPKVSSHFWQVARQVIKGTSPGENLDDVNWTFTSGYQTTALQFTTVGGKPCKLDVSDEHAIDNEQLDMKLERKKWSIDRYKQAYHGQPPKYDEGGGRERTMSPKPDSAFSIPSSHPKAKEGVFYCRPEFYDSPHMHGDYEFFMVDTRKFMGQLQNDNKYFLEDAKRQLKPADTEGWLEQNSIRHPCPLGSFNYSKERGLAMTSGHVEVLQLVQDIGLPYFPIAVPKSVGPDNMRELKAKVGYAPAGGRDMKPAYMKP
jgi:hypothetical protein